MCFYGRVVNDEETHVLGRHRLVLCHSCEMAIRLFPGCPVYGAASRHHMRAQHGRLFGTTTPPNLNLWAPARVKWIVIYCLVSLTELLMEFGCIPDPFVGAYLASTVFSVRAMADAPRLAPYTPLIFEFTPPCACCTSQLVFQATSSSWQVLGLVALPSCGFGPANVGDGVG